MYINNFGQQIHTENDVLHDLYRNPDVDISAYVFDDCNNAILQYNNAVQSHYEDYPKLNYKLDFDGTIEEFDKLNQTSWYMPNKYYEMDIAEWVLNQCETDAELQRCGDELFMFQERDMFPVLCYLKYFVDTMRENNKVWGVGRGSSVASFVLFKIGVHKINSLYFGLDIHEFLR